MATVIDSLLITLGLDASKFDAAQKKSVESLRKFDQANEKSSKQAQLGAAAMNDGFLKLKDTLIQVGVAVVGINGVKDFLNQMVGGNAALGRTSQILGMGARDLHAWGAAMKTVGGTQAGFFASMQNMESGLAGVKFGNTGILTTLSYLGAQGAVDVQKNTVDLIKLSDAIVKSKQRIGTQATFTLAKQLGLDEPTFQLLLKGPAAVSALHDKYVSLDGVTNQNVQAAQELVDKWALLQQQASKTGQAIFAWLTPGLEKALDIATKFLGLDWSASVHKVDRKGSYLSRFKNGLLDIMDNNPGNIRAGKFASAHGAVGVDSRGFAKFSSLSDGEKAMSALLQVYARNGQNTISSIVSRYAPSSENDTAAYIKDVSQRTGIAPNQKLSASQYGAVQNAMIIHEGNGAHMVGARTSSPLGGGSTHVETSIGTINVHTQATDGAGVVRDMHKSLQNNALMGAGMMAGS